MSPNFSWCNFMINALHLASGAPGDTNILAQFLSNITGQNFVRINVTDDALLPLRCHCRAAAAAAAAAARPPSCHQRRAIALPPQPRRRQAAADVSLSRCRHRRSCRAAAAVLLPPCCHRQYNSVPGTKICSGDKTVLSHFDGDKNFLSQLCSGQNKILSRRLIGRACSGTTTVLADTLGFFSIERII